MESDCLDSVYFIGSFFHFELERVYPVLDPALTTVGSTCCSLHVRNTYHMAVSFVES
jgi:hypothetical protein